MSSCSIFAGGEINYYNDLEIFQDDYIICADAGYLHAVKLGLNVNVVIGDFDTYTDYLPDNVEVIKYPPEKDDTDTMLAIKLAIERGYDNIRLYGALGGRIDHSIANIQAINYIKEHGADAAIYNSNSEITILKNEEKSFNSEGFNYISIFSLSDISRGITTSNLKYELYNGELKNSFPLGISNECTEGDFNIRVTDGTLLIILQKE